MGLCLIKGYYYTSVLASGNTVAARALTLGNVGRVYLQPEAQGGRTIEVLEALRYHYQQIDLGPRRPSIFLAKFIQSFNIKLLRLGDEAVQRR